MSLAPTTIVRGAPPALQPYYYTSSLFVEPLRADIADLLGKFKDAVNAKPDGESPFQQFKRIWIETGWKWVHLLVLEERARKTFIEVVERCFLEVLNVSDDLVSSLGALFALYTFHTTQPSALFTIGHIDVPIDVHAVLRNLPSRLSGSRKTEATYIVHHLSVSFRLTPSSTLIPTLPHATIVRVPKPTTMAHGRPTTKTRRENYLLSLRRLTREVDELNSIGDPSGEGEDFGLELPSAEEYVRIKEELVGVLDEDEEKALREGTARTERRMREIEAWAMREGKDVEGYDWEGKPIGLDLVGLDPEDEGS
ncbi:hypothetical protein CALVIDRAFT_603504 [Calocera viscosa TUFC12733]|uniref:Uncharacterized protein n=1 Tax=Calocera viscosa (strain TUFC12733) TaxID=1330018 RepID=A0A167FMH2_CALVF|nr:hypothetical protein CALVIDRAFT_603504 [Calocera viscosa TUFC12733]